MKKIMIDMDDVICEGGFIYLLNKFLGTNYTLNDMSDYYMQELVPDDKKDEWNDFISEQNLYGEGCYFIKDSLKTIEELSKKYEVFIVTAFIFRETPTKSGTHLYNKFKCLCDNMPFLSPKHFIFCDHKELISCDVKIDDKLSNITENADIKLLFDAYHNRNITNEELKKKGARRVCTWREIGALLLDDKYGEE